MKIASQAGRLSFNLKLSTLIAVVALLLLRGLFAVAQVDSNRDPEIDVPPDDALQQLAPNGPWLPQIEKIRGRVKGNGSLLADYRVYLYVSYAGKFPVDHILGVSTTDAAGEFEIRYRLPGRLSPWLKPVYFVIAEKRQAMLAGAVGAGSKILKKVVINERTTVATGTSFAQFVKGRRILGNTYGMLNAVEMAKNMANPKNGRIGEVLARKPNGADTTTLATFNSLTNVVAACIANTANCNALFAATSGGGTEPRNVLQAIANIAKFPAYPNYPLNADDPLFLLSLLSPIYQPALTDRPTNWLLFLKFTGGFFTEQNRFNLMDGPGNVAIDERGFAWIIDNYEPRRPDEVACAGLRLLKFYPWGESFPGSPYFGGGLSGAGFGITFDPRGLIWVGNFGFEAPDCANGTVPPNPSKKIPATHNSVSLFHPSGFPLSPPSGFTRGNISWPQATVSDRKGNIWTANCGNDSVTIIPKGNPLHARNIPLPGGITNTDAETPLLKPFAIAIDPKGRAWVTGNEAQEIYIVAADGSVETVDSSAVAVSWPMGISGDSQGNMWVSSSDTVNIICTTPLNSQAGNLPSLIFYPADGGTPMQYTNVGGLSIPWGNAVDGDDTVWVFNFGRTPMEDADEGFEWPDTGISRFCGVGKCPPGLKLGDAISPDTGYTSDALERITGGAIDPSGNIWLMNNWRKDGPLHYQTNPGGNSFVIVPGAAAPIRTPLIGPPQSFRITHHPDL